MAPTLNTWRVYLEIESTEAYYNTAPPTWIEITCDEIFQIDRDTIEVGGVPIRFPHGISKIESPYPQNRVRLTQVRP